MKRFECAIQGVLAVGLIVAVVYGCKPATGEVDAAGHNPATCEVCSHPNSRKAGAGDTSHDLVVGAERHLALCAECRAAGLTVSDMLAADTPTPCLADYDARQATHSDSETR